MKTKNRIREINPDSDGEINLVASRMRQTLVEVLGQEKGSALYSMDWLVDRVRWHLNPNETTAKIFLSENANEEVVGHAIARIEKDHGYFSTIFIDLKFRNQGLAAALILRVLSWLKEVGQEKVIYNTAKNHTKLIRLFERQGFEITLTEGDMIQLTKLI